MAGERDVDQKKQVAIFGAVQENGEYHARTDFQQVPDFDRKAQFVIHESGGTIQFGRRLQGDSKTVELAQFPTEAAPSFMELLAWFVKASAQGT